MKSYLDGLDLFTEIQGDNLVVECPTFRSDLNIREDIAEEVARIHGYNNFESTIPKCDAKKIGKSEKQKMEDKVRAALVASGINESISYSFGSTKVFDKLLIPQEDVYKRQELDLVVISPSAKPMVCRIMDFGKFVYEQQK